MGTSKTGVSVAGAVQAQGDPVKTVDILISYEVVRLLSEQLYASPVKAIEELVVNGWDAGADNCSVLLDVADDGTGVIAVLDDGQGMTAEQLGDLWHIGVSHKPPLERPRKQIGKFGIGKLASYAVARNATYITRAEDRILAVSIDFDQLVSRTDEAGIARPLTLEIRSLSFDELRADAAFGLVHERLTAKQQAAYGDLNAPGSSWTVVVLENLRDRAQALRSTGRLQWVLETAMPYASDFRLYLNGLPIESSKRDIPILFEFDVTAMEPARLEALNEGGEDWRVEGSSLVSSSFPSGITGNAVVTTQSLYSAGGKSEDLGRSHGFFVRVFGRLINETDPLLGARPLSFSTWYNFAAEVEAPDLNEYITASRDGFEQSALKPKLRDLLIELFNQARDRRESMMREVYEKNVGAKGEGQREYVSRRLVELPLADALVRTAPRDADDEDAAWELVDEIDAESVDQLVAMLYEPDKDRRTYTYRYSALGSQKPFTSFSAVDASVTVNEDHPLVREHADSPQGRRLLELFATAEAMLETYLREASVPIERIRELLSRRDLLLRGLALDESQSLVAIAQEIRDASTASDDSKRFEIALVGGMRSLGFAARHISGSGTPDGEASYRLWGAENISLVLETKASTDTPSLNAIDMAGLTSHAVAQGARGVILVAPTYPGADSQTSEISLRAKQQNVSCWTASDLADVVQSAERRHITAKQIQDIVLTKFSPPDVAAAIRDLLSDPSYSQTAVYQALLDAIGTLSERLPDRPRTIDMLAVEVTHGGDLSSIRGDEVGSAVRDMARASRGLLHVTEDETVILRGDLNEVRRRVAALTDADTLPRRQGTFRLRGTSE